MMFPSALAPRASASASSEQQRIDQVPSPANNRTRKSRTLLQEQIMEEEEKEESSLVSSSELERDSGLNLKEIKSYAVPKSSMENNGEF